jgi:hypothetical protein
MNQAPTITRPAVANRLMAKKNGTVEISTQPANLNGSRTVILRIAEDGRKAVYEIPLDEWSRLNRDAITLP